MLLGVRTVIAVSFERIHRSNLVGMGVLPLQFAKGVTWQSLGLTGEETFDVPGLDDNIKPRSEIAVRATAAGGQGHRVQGHGAHRFAGRSRLLPQRRHPANRAPKAGQREVTGMPPSHF